MPISVTLARKLDVVDPQLREVLWAILDEVERQREESVTKNEFRELRTIVAELAEAQKELAKAQRDTQIKVSELAEAQRDTQIKVSELAEAQRDTQIKVSELAETQAEMRHSMTEMQRSMTEMQRSMTEMQFSIKELAEAHRSLVLEHKKTRTELGGLSETVGFTLENEAFKFLPALLKKEFNLEIKDRLIRKSVPDRKGEPVEVDVVGEAERNGERLIIIGEAKSQLSKSKVDAFFKRKLKPLQGVFDAEIFPILVTHMVSESDAAEYALQRGVKRVYYSYEFV